MHEVIEQWSARRLILAVSLCFAAGADAQQKMSFSIVTGGTGGVWYPLGGAIGGDHRQVRSQHRGDLRGHHRRDRQHEAAHRRQGGALSFAYDYHVGWANEGKVQGLSGKHKVRMVLGFYEQPLHIVTKEGTGIKSLLDLKGKRVSVGAPNSGTEEQADYVLKALGIDWNKDIKREKLGATESVSALKDGKIDAFFWSGAVPTSSIIDLASTPGLKMVLLPVGGQIAERIMKGNPGVFHKTVFAKGDYSDITSDVEAIAITAVLQAMDTFPADKLYQIVKAIFDNKTELTAVWKGATKLTPEKAVGQVTPDALKYLHPGAEKYFKEKGALK